MKRNDSFQNLIKYRPNFKKYSESSLSVAIFTYAMFSSFNGGVFCTLNVGNKNLNMTIIELANKISGLTGSKVSVSEDAQPDKRSYRVSYKKFYSLAKDYLPKDSMNSITKKFLKLTLKFRF